MQPFRTLPLLPRLQAACSHASCVLALATAALLTVTAPARANTALPKVGMAVGQAHLTTSTGQTQPLSPGMALPPGSRIRTGPDAVVLLVFPDQARVSLRASSELVIHRYDLDPNGRDTRMELELVSGAMRQISGTAARTQPERFRLNTPIAAIGVRGTDFMAQTQGQALQAFVHEGAIEVTPALCVTAQCAPILLTSTFNLGAYLRLQQENIERKNLQLQEVEQLFGLGAMTQRRPDPAAMPVTAAVRLPAPVLFSASAAPLYDAQYLLLQNQLASNPPAQHQTPSSDENSTLKPGETAGPSKPVLPQPPTPAPSPQTHPSGEAVSPAKPVLPEPSIPPIAPQPTPAVVTQLVWGRFGNDPQTLRYALLQPYAQAAAGRHVTVGLLGQFGLWRNGPGGDLQPNLSGSTDFRLVNAEAYLHTPDSSSPASVDKASLGINFNQRSFNADLTVSHPQTGVQHLRHSGRLNTEGLFAVTTATDRVAGAVTRDGQEAGMLFSRSLPAGQLQGITLWAR